MDVMKLLQRCVSRDTECRTDYASERVFTLCIHIIYMQGLLENHERVESEVKTYSTEIERLKQFSRKVIEGSSSSGFVSVLHS